MHLRILVALLLLTQCAFGQASERYSRAKVYFDNSHTIRDLSALGVPVDHGDSKKNIFFTSDYSKSDLALIRKAGFRVEILIEDVSRYYAEQNKEKGSTAQKTTTSTDCNSGPVLDMPANFYLGSYGGYFTYTELMDILDSMHAMYPGLISARAAIDTFHSIEGRSLYWVRVSNNPSVEQAAKPQMLYTALHHAREPGSISSTIYYLWYLLEHYSTDPQIKAIIDNTELYFVPCVNPDGYLYNIGTNPTGGGMWRKNRRRNADGTYGVDLNRNYGEHWGYDNIGSSPSTSSDTYRGTAGFSEPETQAIKWLAEQHHFKISLNYHTFGNDLIYPWGYIGSLLTPDSSQFSAYGAYLTHFTPYRFGTGDQTVGYVTNGDSDDWMYGDTTRKPKIFGMTPETGRSEFGFYTPLANIIPDCQNNLRTNINAATLLLPFAKIGTDDEQVVTKTSGYLHYSLQRLGFPDTATFTVTMTSLDSWLTITGSPRSFTSLSMLQQESDSFAYTLSAATPNGQLVRYERKLYNGFYYIKDTVQFYYGKYYRNLQPGTNDFADWTNFGWDTCNRYYHSAPASLASNTNCGNYPNNNELQLKLNTTVDLTHAIHAYLYFYSKWGIESSYDYLVAECTPTSSGIAMPLCGRFTKPGTLSQMHDEPIYDGQQPAWVQEEYNLQDYIGQKINLQFRLVADAAANYTGFYLDDMNLISVQDSTILSVGGNLGELPKLPVYPNPANGEVNIELNDVGGSEPLEAAIYNTLGQDVAHLKLPAGKTAFDTRSLPNGMYYLKVANNVKLPVTRMEIWNK